jgi:hypothetical protein
LALRFSGQRATDAFGVFYDYQRDYDPMVGRYPQRGGIVGQIASHPEQTAMAVAAVASACHAKMLSRLGTGVAVSTGFSPYIGVPVSGLAIYGSAFKAAYQHPDALYVSALLKDLGGFELNSLLLKRLANTDMGFAIELYPEECE